ncbi:hypothetical protein R3P38DRAFT_3243716 [Favolaschia claudopus]|uniref:CCHC-type domain-containing protein n=1 Tax=Favolaschia claudopus TaxID=2862362 RepID=A0AAV9Z2Q9_9AGAR
MSNAGISGRASDFLHNSGGNPPATPISSTLAKPGEVVLSAEAVAILRKMDILRLARNNKRDERRKAKEENVSEDEAEELTPYIMVVPSGEALGANVIPDVISTPTLLFDDAAAARNSFQANDNSIPAAIIFLAKNGISPPLTLFLPASLARIRSSNIKTVKHGTGESTKVTVIDISDFPDELALDQATWCTCYNTFLTFMESVAGTQVFQGFAAHFNNVLSNPDFAQWFQAYRDFDQRLRARFFTTPFIINIRDEEYRAALQSAINLFLVESRTPNTVGFKATKDKSERPKPYDKDLSARKKNTLCFRCGRTGHGAVACEEKNPSRHGREFVAYANKDGLFRLSDKRPICLFFNCGTDRCTSTRPHALHIFSLCSDSHHGASECTRNSPTALRKVSNSCRISS